MKNLKKPYRHRHYLLYQCRCWSSTPLMIFCLLECLFSWHPSDGGPCRLVLCHYTQTCLTDQLINSTPFCPEVSSWCLSPRGGSRHLLLIFFFKDCLTVQLSNVWYILLFVFYWVFFLRDIVWQTSCPISYILMSVFLEMQFYRPGVQFIRYIRYLKEKKSDIYSEIKKKQWFIYLSKV